MSGSFVCDYNPIPLGHAARPFRALLETPIVECTAIASEGLPGILNTNISNRFLLLSVRNIDLYGGPSYRGRLGVCYHVSWYLCVPPIAAPIANLCPQTTSVVLPVTNAMST